MESWEKSQFENDMKINQELYHAVEFERKLLTGLHLVGDKELRKQIQAVHDDLAHQQFFEKKDNIISINSINKRTFMKRIIAIAAAAVVLLGVVWFSFLKEKPAADPNEVFAQHFKPETSRLGEVLAGFPAGFAGELTAQDSLKEALKLYEQGKYDEAVAALDSVLVRHPANDTATFYLGMAHLNSERYARALEVLTPITTNESSAFKLESTWYTGLCYLKVDNGLDKAKDIFSGLANNAEYKDRQAAKGVLNLIEK